MHAVADALAVEYDAIVGAGCVLQIDCPDLAMERHTLFADRPLGDFLAWVELVVAAINRALARIPPARVRLHVCWGNYEAPHTFDVPLDDILPLLYAARVGALVLSMANPRHAHEHRVLARAPAARRDAADRRGHRYDDATTSSTRRSSPTASRRPRRAVGDPHRVLAGTDCGFDTAAGLGAVAEEVVWEKLKALRAGADLASTRLF